MNDFIRVYDNALSPALCQQIIDTFEQSSQVAPGRVGGGVDPQKKHSSDLTIHQQPEWRQLDQVIRQATFAALKDYLGHFPFTLIGTVSPMVPDPATGQPTTLTLDNFEQLGRPRLDALVRHVFRCSPINVQRYRRGEGGYPLWHSEIYPLDANCEQLHRALLFLVYLNDVDEGGETEFFYQQRAVKPRRGSLVIAPAGFTHTHRGNVPLSGDKYVLAGWVLFNRAEQIYSAAS